jgi:hypothetical protein
VIVSPVFANCPESTTVVSAAVFAVPVIIARVDDPHPPCAEGTEIPSCELTDPLLQISVTYRKDSVVVRAAAMYVDPPVPLNLSIRVLRFALSV